MRQQIIQDKHRQAYRCTCHGGQANCTQAFPEQGEAEQMLSVLGPHFKENAFVIRFNAASFNAAANEEPTYHSARMRYSFNLSLPHSRADKPLK